MHGLIESVSFSLMPVILLVGFFWGADKLISEKGAKRLYAYIKDAVSNTEKSRIFLDLKDYLDKNYSLTSGLFNVFRNVLIFTIISMMVTFSVYAAIQPSILDVLFTSGFLKQFLGSGLLIVLLTNLAAVALYPITVNGLLSDSPWKSVGYLLGEAVIKVLVFLVVTLLTWSYFAYVEGAFGGGGAKAALEAIPPTLRLALSFNNLTSVYLYSVALSSFPFFIISLLRLMSKYPMLARSAETTLFWLPLENKPIRVASLTAGMSTFMLCSSVAGVAMLGRG